MESMTLKIQELEKEISEFNIKIEEDKKRFLSLNLEITRVKLMQNEENCSFNDFKRRSEKLSLDLKDMHEVYQQLPQHSMKEYIKLEIHKRKNELLEEKEKLESRLGLLKLKRSMQEEKLEELKIQAMIQQKKKKAVLLKLQKNIAQSEEAKKEKMTKLKELKNEMLNL